MPNQAGVVVRPSPPVGPFAYANGFWSERLNPAFFVLISSGTRGIEMRRALVGLLGAATVTAALSARAHQGDRAPLIGYPSPLSPRSDDDEFRAGLRELGYVEVKTLQIEARYADGHADRPPASRPNWSIRKSTSLWRRASTD